ncbi:hypothetical protein D3C80_2084400 [compost metagenome]
MTAWGRCLTPSLRKVGVIWALMETRRLVVLDVHLLQGDDSLGAILDAEFAEGGSDMGPEGNKNLSCP